jgi:hypothetical protein
MSFLETLSKTVYLDYVLKILGIVLFALALFRGWNELSFLNKGLLVCGPIAWFVGAHFSKVYR